LPRELARAKQRYASDAFDAYRITAENLIPHLGVDFHMTAWSRRAQEAFRDQWLSTGASNGCVFDWEQIFHRYREPDQLEMAIWAPDDRLCGLGLATTTSKAIKLEFIEGDPRADCPL
jgi:hypothetical protein